MRHVWSVILLLMLAIPAFAQSACPQCGRIHGPKVSSPQVAADGYPVVYVGDKRAYDWALREAKILASRGTAGHPMGCAPGTTASGTGYSWDINRPNHCFYRSGRRLVARARVIVGSRAFWSAHYR